MSKYTRGAAFEYRCKHYLESFGWKVFRCAGSHSCSDLLAFKGKRTLWIQCKGKPKPGLKRQEKLDLLQGKTEHGVIPLAMCRKGKAPFNFLYYAIAPDLKVYQVKEPRWLKE